MIVVDRDILVKLVESNQAVIDHLKQYRGEEWTIPSLVAWESYKAQDSRQKMMQAQQRLQSDFDRILNFSDDAALEAAYLQDRLQSQGNSLDTVDLLNLATAYNEGATFITHNKNDFDKEPLLELADVDVVHTA
ncbi:type II toxin-antitoxin system VapC family toxin [Haloarcula argentinensis]|jgi:tRNA(fMet)-specific endonuclease VapC|uniref:PIN domain-containing protein n=1 Tax=Haloarcula argentinensis TaxID=43776 RepID=A0A847UHB7_HALAR|nr:type II toxin-antitoxin system VapC family toxin [Haloarcula argentinensis]NLV11866.1 PIN domain-containing protein [Haloarcula argentinensis]